MRYGRIAAFLADFRHRALERIRGTVRVLSGGNWKTGLSRLAMAGGVVAAGGLLYAWSGLIPISASSGHWAATRWLLGFSMRNAVETQSLSVQGRDLHDPALILKGAGHYATGCAPCHGAPGEAASVIARQMTPKPPSLPPRIHHWNDRELFWIVRNGIKFTAMPAWPALERNDEVWAMVAFLRRLPDLDVRRYRALAYGDEGTDDAPARAFPDPLRRISDSLGPVLDSCARCHGFTGSGRGTGAFPKLNGQSRAYLLASLRAYAAGERNSGIMEPIAAGLSDQVMGALATYYARQPPFGLAEPPVGNPSALGLGATAAAGGAEGRVPRCEHCHGGGGLPRNPRYPRLAGQHADYLALQLELFKSGARGGTAYAPIMEVVAARLTAEQIQELAARFAASGRN